MVRAQIICLLAFLLPRHLVIGDYVYKVSTSNETLGLTYFPKNDMAGERYIVLPDMPDQQAISLVHEELHACMHDHPHFFKTDEELAVHLKASYTEEEAVTLLAPCMLATIKESIHEGLVK